MVEAGQNKSGAERQQDRDDQQDDGEQAQGGAERCPPAAIDGEGLALLRLAIYTLPPAEDTLPSAGTWHSYAAQESSPTTAPRW